MFDPILIVCNDDEFQCNSGYCIPSVFECDGVASCPDGDDELNCSGKFNPKTNTILL